MAQSVPPPSKSPQPDADAASRDFCLLYRKHAWLSLYFTLCEDLEEGGDITFNEDQEDEDKVLDVAEVCGLVGCSALPCFHDGDGAD
eukprot:5504976-Amphidinium_carterae.1